MLTSTRKETMKNPHDVSSRDAADDDQGGQIPTCVNGDILRQENAEASG